MWLCKCRWLFLSSSVQYYAFSLCPRCSTDLHHMYTTTVWKCAAAHNEREKEREKKSSVTVMSPQPCMQLIVSISNLFITTHPKLMAAKRSVNTFALELSEHILVSKCTHNTSIDVEIELVSYKCQIPIVKKSIFKVRSWAWLCVVWMWRSNLNHQFDLVKLISLFLSEQKADEIA